MDLGLDGRVYLVTGGSRGLGFAAAQALVADGARVVLSAPHEGTASSAVARLAQDAAAAEPAAWVIADNADPGYPGPADRGGQGPVRPPGRRADQRGRIAVGDRRDDDGRGVAVRVRERFPRRRPAGPDPGGRSGRRGRRGPAGGSVAGAGGSVTGAGGSIVFVLASSVRVPLAELAIANGLFPGLAGVVKTLAGELGPAGIRVNALLPVRIATDRVRELDALQGDPDEVRARLSEHIPLRRYGEPEEFGRAAAFVLSPAASYITGAMIPVDGGAISSI